MVRRRTPLLAQLAASLCAAAVLQLSAAGTCRQVPIATDFYIGGLTAEKHQDACSAVAPAAFLPQRSCRDSLTCDPSNLSVHQPLGLMGFETIRWMLIGGCAPCMCRGLQREAAYQLGGFRLPMHHLSACRDNAPAGRPDVTSMRFREHGQRVGCRQVASGLTLRCRGRRLRPASVRCRTALETSRVGRSSSSLVCKPACLVIGPLGPCPRCHAP